MVSIHVPDEIASALAAQAHALGVSVESYLAQIAKADHKPAQCISPGEVDALLDSVSVPGPTYAGTHPRSEIYSDHD